MKSLPVVFVIFQLCISWATGASVEKKQLSEVQVEILREIANELIESTHPSLDSENLRLTFYTINKDDYFMQSNFTLGRVFLGRPHYRIGVNPIIFEWKISRMALKGVMAHELVHTEDYRSGTTIGKLLPIGLKVLRKSSRIQYERKTDLKVVAKGLGPELRAYREWQYKRLSPEDLVIKKMEYLSIEEIDFLENLSQNILLEPLIDEWLEGRIPKSLMEFKSQVDLNLD